MEEIEKLRIRVEKDPNSRLFLPLAEEYRKSGMPDEAISVILRGLEHQPGYTSARVALGRIYMEKGMLDEARKEFEAVVSAIPDNLFAHRKLADIYREKGEIRKAAAEYRTVIRLNPLDEEAKICLSEIEDGPHGEEALPFAEVEEHAQPDVSEIPIDEGQGIPGAEFTELEGISEEPDEAGIAHSGPEEPGGEEDIIEEAEEISDISGEEAFPLRGEPVYQEEAYAAEEAPESAQHAMVLEEDRETFSGISESPFEIPESAGAHGGIEASETPSGAADISAADSFIAAGDFCKALEVYRKALSGAPDDKHLLQRMLELKSLMKLMGKGEEVLIGRLEEFLDAIRRRFPKGT